MLSARATVILPTHRALDLRSGGRARRDPDRHHRPRHRPGVPGPRTAAGAPSRAAARPGSPGRGGPGGDDPAQRRAGGAVPNRPGRHRRCAVGPAVGGRPPGTAGGRCGSRAGRARRGRRLDPVRRRPGGSARRAPRNLSLCDLVVVPAGFGGNLLRHPAGTARSRGRRHEGLRDAGRWRPVPLRARRPGRRESARTRPRVRHHHRPTATVWLVRRGRRPLRRAGCGHRRRSR